MAGKKVLVIGASDNPSRYAFKAVNMLNDYGHDVYPLGIRKGSINGIQIDTDATSHDHVDTVTLYVSPTIQDRWKDYIITTKPKRVIFNPGTENPEFEKTLQNNGIETEQACTLVLLQLNQF